MSSGLEKQIIARALELIVKQEHWTREVSEPPLIDSLLVRHL